MTRSAIPGPGLFQFVRNIRSNPVAYCYELMRQYGDVVKCPSIRNIYLVNHPMLAKEVFLQAQKSFDRNDFVNLRLRKVMGEGVVLTTGRQWKQQRQAAQTAFNPAQLIQHTPLIEKAITTMVSRLRSNAENAASWNVHEDMRWLVMTIMAGYFLQISDRETIGRLIANFNTGNEYVSASSPWNLPAWVPGSRRSTLDKAIADVDDILLKAISASETDDRSGQTLVSSISARQEGITSDQILAEVKNIFIASYFSMVDLLSWLLYSLAKYPAWTASIYEEFMSSKKSFELGALARPPLGESARPPLGESAGPPLGTASRSFVHEVLRCYPPGWSSVNRVLATFQLGPYVIPKNSVIFISIYNIHHHPVFWSEPDQFNPRRFYPDNNLPLTDIFIPYGKGPRKCIGMGLANRIIGMVLSEMVTRFQFSVDQLAPPVIQSRASLGSREDIKIRLHPRIQPYNDQYEHPRILQ